MTQFSEKNVIYHKMCVVIFSTALVWNISHSKKNWARYYYIFHTSYNVYYPLFLSDFNPTWISSTDYPKKSVITKFHENPFGESRVVPRGRSEMTELTQLRVDAQKLQYIFRLFFLLLDPNGLEWYVVGTEQVFDIVL